MRWLPLVVVSALVVAVLVASDPGAVGLHCASNGNPQRWTAAPEAEFIGPCRLRGVVDGDTLDLACPGAPEERIRLLRVDTPERDAAGHREARQALGRAAGRGTLRLLLEEPGEPLRDRYGRLLGYVYAGERNLNVEQVRSGWSRFEARFGGGRFARAFQAAEAEAREARRGLWAAAPAP